MLREEERAAIQQVIDSLIATENIASMLNVADLNIMNTGYTIQDSIQHLYEELHEMVELDNEEDES